MAEGRVGREPRSRERTATVVVPFPRGRAGSTVDLSRLLPSARSLLTAVAIAVVAVTAYFVARDTSVFAVRTVDVAGAPPSVVLQVRRALREDFGTSLLRVDVGRARELVAAVPTVASASFDRAFPHTLRVVVVPERPVAVVRQGATSWLVSARGRVMANLAHGARRRLPRIWVPQGAVFTVGGMAPATLHDSLAAVAPLAAAHFPARVASVRSESDELTLLLRSGLEVRLGDATDVQLKLAVAAKVLPLVAADTRYVDVSVPERPVAGSIVHAPSTAKTQTTSSTTTSSTASVTAQSAPASTHDGGSASLNSQVKVDTLGSTGP